MRGAWPARPHGTRSACPTTTRMCAIAASTIRSARRWITPRSSPSGRRRGIAAPADGAVDAGAHRVGRMSAAVHAYRYAYPSTLDVATAPRLSLATTDATGKEHPHFFEGD